MKKEYQATNYESDLTDKQWEAIKEFFPSGNKSKYHKRSLVEAVLYIVKTGCQWRMLPHDYPPHDTVWSFYRRARENGVKALYRYPTIQAGCADGGYRGTFQNTFDEFHNIRIDISMRIKEQKGFQVLPKRWVVERTFAWLNGSRRLSKDYETSCCSAETMIMISHAATLLNRL